MAPEIYRSRWATQQGRNGPDQNGRSVAQALSADGRVAAGPQLDPARFRPDAWRFAQAHAPLAHRAGARCHQPSGHALAEYPGLHDIGARAAAAHARQVGSQARRDLAAIVQPDGACWCAGDSGHCARQAPAGFVQFEG